MEVRDHPQVGYRSYHLHLAHLSGEHDFGMDTPCTTHLLSANITATLSIYQSSSGGILSSL